MKLLYILLISSTSFAACEIKQICKSVGNCEQVQLCDEPYDMPVIDIPPVPQYEPTTSPDIYHPTQDDFYYR